MRLYHVMQVLEERYGKEASVKVKIPKYQLNEPREH